MRSVQLRAWFSYIVIFGNRKQVQRTDQLQELAQIPFTVTLYLLGFTDDYDSYHFTIIKSRKKSPTSALDKAII